MNMTLVSKGVKMTSPEDKIVSYLMQNMEDLQLYVNVCSNSAPDFIIYDVVVRRIEEGTGCNYIDVITYFDQHTFNRMFLIGGYDVEN